MSFEKQTRTSHKKIAIIGLGLIGGSLGFVLKKRFPNYEVIGLSRSPAKINLAKKKAIIDWGSIHSRKVLNQADLVFICTPVSAITHWIGEAEKWGKSGMLVTDVGSTKQEIVRWAESQRFKKICFVGAHPMAGSHQSGIEFARSDLFRGSLTFVTKTPKTDSEALKKIVNFWKKISERVVVLNPSQHDRITAQISHTPHALASILLLSVSRNFLSYAASGFLDTTRIAQGDPGLWLDILMSNNLFLIQALRRHLKMVDQFIGYLKRGRKSKIFSLLKKSSMMRKKINHPPQTLV